MSNNEQTAIDAVMSRTLQPVGLDEQHLNQTLASMMQGGVDYADLYFQVSRQESWTVEDSIIREGSFSLDQGVGVRAVSGEKTGFAYSDELMLPALQQAATAARAIARAGKDPVIAGLATQRRDAPVSARGPDDEYFGCRENSDAGRARAGDARARRAH